MKKNLIFLLVLIAIVFLPWPSLAFESGFAEPEPISTTLLLWQIGAAALIGIITAISTISLEKYDKDKLADWLFVIILIGGAVIFIIWAKADPGICVLTFLVFIITFTVATAMIGVVSDLVYRTRNAWIRKCPLNSRKRMRGLILGTILFLLPASLLAANPETSSFSMTSGAWLCLGICFAGGFICEFFPQLLEIETAQPIIHILFCLIGLILVVIFFETLSVSLLSGLAYFVGFLIARHALPGESEKD